MQNELTQAQKKQNERNEVEPVLKAAGFCFDYMGKKGHGYGLWHSGKSIGYTRMATIKQLIKKNALSDLLIDLHKRRFTDEAIEQMTKELAAKLSEIGYKVELSSWNEVRAIITDSVFYIELCYNYINPVDMSFVIKCDVVKQSGGFCGRIATIDLDNVMSLFNN